MLESDPPSDLPPLINSKHTTHTPTLPNPPPKHNRIRFLQYSPRPTLLRRGRAILLFRLFLHYAIPNTKRRGRRLELRSFAMYLYPEHLILWCEPRHEPNQHDKRPRRDPRDFMSNTLFHQRYSPMRFPTIRSPTTIRREWIKFERMYIRRMRPPICHR